MAAGSVSHRRALSTFSSHLHLPPPSPTTRVASPSSPGHRRRACARVQGDGRGASPVCVHAGGSRIGSQPGTKGN
ncbi:Os08g0310300 [Oryza sativa Japonica Group]|uniref:Os08g0310300 protein n=2 Tax=Oryza TaxID=4527 RepID=A0A0P0XE91_ORYSJ|nr:Os08g0310300 [Oryza sativa Japonica Group]